MKYSIIAAVAVSLPSLTTAASSSYYPFQFFNSSSSISDIYTDVTIDIDITTDLTTTLDTTTTETDYDTIYSSTSYLTVTRDHRSSVSAVGGASPISSGSYISTTPYASASDEITSYLDIEETGDPATLSEGVEATSLVFGTTTRVYTDCNYEGVCSTMTTRSLVASYPTTVSGRSVELTTYRPLTDSLSSSPSITSSGASSTAAAESSIASSSGSSINSVGPAVPRSGSSSASSSASSSSGTTVSSPSVSSTAAPYKIPINNGGQPSWEVYVPALLGSWSSVELVSTLDNANYIYDCSAFTFEIDGVTADPINYASSCTEDNFDIQFGATAVGTLRVGIFATKNSDDETAFDNTVIVSVSSNSIFSRIKRAIMSWTLTDTLIIGASSSSGAGSTRASSSSSTAEVPAVTTSSTQVLDTPAATTNDDSESSSSKATGKVSTSTATVSEGSTVIVTVTHCDAGACTVSTSAALNTVVTTTILGSVTTYTTYCPLTAESTTSSASSGSSSSSTLQTVITTTLPGQTEATILPINDVATVAVVGPTTVSNIVADASATLASSSSTYTGTLVPSVLQGSGNSITKGVFSGLAGIAAFVVMMI